METKIIARVNNVDIVSTSDEQRLIPIKPICEALGIDYATQFSKLKEDDFLSSTIGLSPTVGADGKEREMVCIPLEFVFGWLFTINPKNVKEEAQESVRQYRIQCYRALFEHFTEPQTFLKQKQVAIEKEVSEYQERQKDFKDAKKRMDESKARLNKTMSITIEDWRANNRQLSLFFDSEESTE